MALLYLATVISDDFVLSCSRRDLENLTPNRFRLRRSLTLSLSLPLPFLFCSMMASISVSFATCLKEELGLFLPACLLLELFPLPLLHRAGIHHPGHAYDRCAAPSKYAAIFEST